MASQGRIGCSGSCEILLQTDVDDTRGSDREATELQQSGEKRSCCYAAITSMPTQIESIDAIDHERK